MTRRSDRHPLGAEPTAPGVTNHPAPEIVGLLITVAILAVLRTAARDAETGLSVTPTSASSTAALDTAM